MVLVHVLRIHFIIVFFVPVGRFKVQRLACRLHVLKFVDGAQIALLLILLIVRFRVLVKYRPSPIIITTSFVLFVIVILL